MADRWVQVRCRVLLGLWVAAVVVVSVQATVHPHNNFEIFRTAWSNLVSGHDLYGPSTRHRDFFIYSPSFALLFAPFALVPLWLGVLMWNAVNAAALYWGLGRALPADQAFGARLIVLMDAIGAMQNVQSNALIAGLIVITFAELERRRERTAAIALVLATSIKIFPIVAALFGVFRPWRLPRLVAWCTTAAAALLAGPLLVISPAELVDQYRSWATLGGVVAIQRNYSVMAQLPLWFGVDWPNWPIQLVGVIVLVAPLAQVSRWGEAHFRQLFLASLLMFCVLFNHKAESPSFVIAMAGVAVWFVTSARGRLEWTVLGVVIVVTVLSASDAMPEVLQQRLFMPYKLKTLPVLLVWVLTQTELWRFRRNATARFQVPGSKRVAPQQPD